jgi:hypothetical protein
VVSASIFDVAAKVRGLEFQDAKIFIAQTIGRLDLIRQAKRQDFQRMDAAALLNPSPENRDDPLVRIYLGHRLGIPPERVLSPTTKVVGLKSLTYFDAPRSKGGKPVIVGDFPAAIFETVDRDNKRHAHRIYLAAGGLGKAELGFASDGQLRDPKKSATKNGNESTAAWRPATA